MHEVLNGALSCSDFLTEMTPGDEMLPGYSPACPTSVAAVTQPCSGFQQPHLHLHTHPPHLITTPSIPNTAIPRPGDPSLALWEDPEFSSFLNQLQSENIAPSSAAAMPHIPATQQGQQVSKHCVSSAHWELARKLTQAPSSASHGWDVDVDTKPILFHAENTAGFMPNTAEVSQSSLVEETASLGLYPRCTCSGRQDKMRMCARHGAAIATSGPVQGFASSVSPFGGQTLRTGLGSLSSAPVAGTTSAAPVPSTSSLTAERNRGGPRGAGHESAQQPQSGPPGGGMADIDFPAYPGLDYPVKMQADNLSARGILPPPIDFSRRGQLPAAAMEARPGHGLTVDTSGARGPDSHGPMRADHFSMGSSAQNFSRGGRGRMRCYSSPSPRGPPRAHMLHSSTSSSLSTNSNQLQSGGGLTATRTCHQSSSATKRRRQRSLSTDDSYEIYDEESDNLSPEDEDRRQRRREQNKMAAQRCRERKKAASENLVKEYQRLECNNTELRFEIRNLEREQKKLADVYERHLPSCSKKPDAHSAHAQQGTAEQAETEASIDLDFDLTDPGDSTTGAG